MRTETIQVLKFNELTDNAKAKARDWYRGTNDGCCDWAENVLDDAKHVARLMGVEVDRIGFSGFWSQGDGANFTGTFGYAKGCAKAVTEYAPQDTDLQKIAQEWQALQAANFYQLNGTVSHRGHYQHAYCTDFEVYRGNTDATEYADEAVREVLRDLMNWIYARLEQEHDWLNSDETVDGNIVANEYEFTDDGSIH